MIPLWLAAGASFSSYFRLKALELLSICVRPQARFSQSFSFKIDNKYTTKTDSCLSGDGFFIVFLMIFTKTGGGGHESG